MKKLIQQAILVGGVVIASGTFLQAQSVAVSYRVRNPLSYGISQEPITANVPAGDQRALVFYDPRTKQPLPSQCDRLPDGRGELVGLVSLASGESADIEVREGPAAPAVKGAPTATAGKEGIILANSLFSCQVNISGPGQHGVIFCPVDTFKFEPGGVPAGAKKLAGGFQVGGFKGEPTMTLRSGPARAQVILEGPSEAWYDKYSVRGRTRAVFSIYANRTVLDCETTFIPQEENADVWLVSPCALEVDTSTGPWKVSSLDYNSPDKLERYEVDFGVDASDRKHTGHLWCAARGEAGALSYVFDERNSTVGMTPGPTGAMVSDLRWLTWNFSKEMNYVRPDLFGVGSKRDVPLTIRMRLGLYPQAQADDRFASRDWEILHTRFLSPLLVKQPTSFTGSVALSDEARTRIGRLLRQRDVAIVAGENLSPEAMVGVRRLADLWQAPLLTSKGLGQFLTRQYPRYTCDDVVWVLAGSPQENSIVDAYNEKYGFVDNYYPGAGKGRIAIIEDFMVPGRQVVYVGGGDPEGAVRACEAFAESFKPETLTSPQLRVLSTEARVRPWMRKASAAQTVKLTACRGETASAHVLLYAPQELRDVKAIVTLKGPKGTEVPATLSHIPWHFARLDGKGGVFLKREKGEFICPEPQNDALWEGVPATLTAESQTSLWVNIEVSQDLPAGSYSGAVQLSWVGGAISLPLDLTVVNVTLPSKWAMDLFLMYGIYGNDGNQINLYLNIPQEDKSMYRQALAGLGGLLVSHGATVASVSGYDFRVVILPDGAVRILPSETDLEIEAYRQGGCNGLFEIQGAYWQAMISLIAQMRGVSEDEARKVFGDLFRQWARERGLEGKLVVRVGDEPGDIDKWVKEARPLKDCGMAITVASNKCDMPSLRKMISTIDLWCPNWIFFITRYGHPKPDNDPAIFNAQFLAERKAAGDRVWNYTCKGGAPYVDLRESPTEIRYLLWDSYCKGAEGVVYYGGGNWSHNWGGGEIPGKNVTELRDYYAYDVLAGNPEYPGGWVSGTEVFYPDVARHRVIASQRFELFRNAQQDLKLFSLFRQKFGAEALNQLLAPVLKTEYEDVTPLQTDAVRQDAVQRIAQAI